MYRSVTDRPSRAQLARIFGTALVTAVMVAGVGTASAGAGAVSADEAIRALDVPSPSAPIMMPRKIRKAFERQRHAKPATTVRRLSNWYGSVYVGASCFFGVASKLMVHTPIVRPLSGSFQTVALKADEFNATGASSTSDWWVGTTTNWGEYINYGGWRFQNVRTRAVSLTPHFMHDLLPGSISVRVMVAWFSSTGTIVKQQTIWLSGSDFDSSCY
jgi:hypothetical protein